MKQIAELLAEQQPMGGRGVGVVVGDPFDLKEPRSMRSQCDQEFYSKIKISRI